MKPSFMDHWLVRILPIALALGCLFATVLVGIDRFAFRDVGHFYTPLYDYIGDRTLNDGIPLWNPLDRTGVPLIGETTTAVLYPIRFVLFCLPLSTSSLLGWYVALHLFIGFAATYQCSRWFRCSQQSAALAGTVFALSGSVLFLYTNPPFLVGAAWLPLALGALLTPMRMPWPRRTLLAGFALSMMVLGGDPQSSFHATVISAFIVAWRVMSERGERRVFVIRAQVAPVLFAPLLATTLAAPQIAASISWSKQSDRVIEESNPSFFGAPDISSRKYESFQFSLPPWHLLELVTPNAAGSHLPQHRRVSRLIPGDGRMWTPTIYLGSVAILALLSQFSARRKTRNVWTFIAISAFLLSMGHFGVVWLCQQVFPSMRQLDSGALSPYWALYHFVPGYDAFRYPTKWLPFFSLAVAMLTAIWIDGELTRNWKATRRALFFVVSIIATALVSLSYLVRNPRLISTSDSNPIIDEFWGPLDIVGGLNEIWWSFLHSLVSMVAICLATWLWRREVFSRKQLKSAISILVALDLALVGYQIIYRVPVDLETKILAARHSIDKSENHRWFRTQSGLGWPDAWQQKTNPTRLTDVEVSCRHAWFGRWHLVDRQNVFNNMLSIEHIAIQQFWHAADLHTESYTLQQRSQFWNRVKRWLQVDGSSHTTSREWKQEVDGQEISLVENLHQVQPSVPYLSFQPTWKKANQSTSSVEKWQQLLSELEQQRRTIWIDCQIDPPPIEPESIIAPKMELVRSESDSEIIEVETHIPGYVVRPCLQDGHWKAEYRAEGTEDWRPLTVHRVDFLKQGTLVPPGKGRLRFRYRPNWLSPTLAIAGSAWAMLVVLGLFQLRRRRYLPMQKRPNTRSSKSSV